MALGVVFTFFQIVGGLKDCVEGGLSSFPGSFEAYENKREEQSLDYVVHPSKISSNV